MSIVESTQEDLPTPAVTNTSQQLDLSKLDYSSLSVSETEQTQSSVIISQKETSSEPAITETNPQSIPNDVIAPSQDIPAQAETKNALEDPSQNLGNSVVQEDRIDLFTSGMEQEFPLTDGANVKPKANEEQTSSLAKENGNLSTTLDLSDKENKQREKSHFTSHRTSQKLDESSRDKNRGSVHHTHKDLREILTKNSFVSNKNRDFEDHKIKKTPRSDKYSLARDRESTQRHRRIYQEIKNTLTYSTASVVSQREIDPEREWEDKKREREIQRIEVERARKELETRRRQDSQSSQGNPNSLKRSLSSYSQDTRPLTIEGGHSEYPIPPIVRPLPSEAPATRIARVQNLVRPFTQQQLKCMLELYGLLIVGTDTSHQYFWTDKNKTQCCCVYQNIESCEKARNALHGARWPSINPKNLNFSFLAIENYNELTGLGIDQEILDKTFQVTIEKEIAPPAPKVAKIQDKGKVNKDKEKKEKPKEREKIREKERDNYRDVSKKVKKDKTSHEYSEKRISGPSIDKKSHGASQKKDAIPKLREPKIKSADVSIAQAPVKSLKESVETQPKLKEERTKIPSDKQRISEHTRKVSDEKHKKSDEKHKISEEKHKISDEKHKNTDEKHKISDEKQKISDEKHKISEQKHKISEEKHRISEEKHKISDEKHKISEEKLKKSAEKSKIPEKKLVLKRLPVTEEDTQPPQPKKLKDAPPLQTESDLDSDNYQCSGQAALLDNLFRKTVSEPCIYWLPLTDKQVKAKLKRKQLEAEKSQSRRAKQKYSRSPRRKRK